MVHSQQMFRSKTRHIIFPQSEHGRLAGTIAALWGNDDFDKPPFSFESFVAGVILHDEGHGYFDMDDIGGHTPQEALDAMQRLVDYRLDDPIADTVANFHILRLLHLEDVWYQLIEQCEQKIADGIAKTQISRDDYLWADKITHLCDSIAFDFCFDAPVKIEAQVSARQGRADTITVRYELDNQGKIVVDPWPLRVDAHEGFILAYEADLYPDQLKPVIVSYVLSRRQG